MKKIALGLPFALTLAAPLLTALPANAVPAQVKAAAAGCGVIPDRT